MNRLINNTICLFLDLYYNENYAGLAAEIFGLTETNIQSDDSTAAADTVPPCDVVDEDQLSAGLGTDAVPLMVDGGEAVVVATEVVEGEIVVLAEVKVS